MRALAVLFFILGIFALYQPEENDLRGLNMARAVGINYAAYRQAAFRYCYGHRHITGVIPRNVLELPLGYNPIREWEARVQDGRLYVFGEGSYREAMEARAAFMGSYAVGFNDGGHLLPELGHPITVPAFIPNGSIVSITEIDYRAAAP